MKHFSSWLYKWQIIGLLCTLLGISRTQAQTWQTAVAVKQSPGDNSYVDATAADANGNVYLVGSFNGTAVFGTISLTSVGAYNAFVAKWSTATNSFLWARRVGESTAVTAVAINGSSIYIAGDFVGSTARFGDITLTNAGDTNGRSDGFIAKLTEAGTSATFEWAQQLGGTEYDAVSTIAVSGNNIYVAGYFANTATFGSLNLTSAGGSDAFVAKLIDAGTTSNFAWAQRGGGIASDGVEALAVSGTSLYVTGSLGSVPADFGNITLSNGENLFVAKLTDAGNAGSFIWAERTGGTIARSSALAVSGNSVYVVGSFTGTTVNFGATTLTTTTRSTRNAFVTKLTDAGSSGSFIWSLWGGASEQGTVTATDVAATGSSVYLGGWYYGTTTTFGNTTLTNNGLVGTMNALVAKVIDAGSTGSFIWTQQGGGMADDDVSAIAISGANVYVAGSAGMMARFGSQTLLDIAGNSQVVYLARLTEQPLAVSAPKRAILGIYPNPAHTLARVAVPRGIALVQLQDVLGHVLQNVPVRPDTTEAVLSLDGLPTGLYLVRVGDSTGKLLVE